MKDITQIEKHFKIYRKIEKKLKKSKKDLEKLDHYKVLHAGGLFENLKQAFTWRNDLSNSDKACLEKYGDVEISKIVIVRQPLGILSKLVADALTLGDFDVQLKRLGYDRAYHLYLLIYLSDPDNTCILTERNESVRLFKTTPKLPKGAETKEIPVENLTLLEFFHNGVDSVSDPSKFFKYDPITQNCQIYVMTLLKANSLSTPEIEKWVLQDSKEILKNSPVGKSVFQRLSNGAARIRFLLGKGLEI